MAIIQFPKDFLWGAATASYQVEGAANEDGRKPSIWDTFSRTPGKVKNGDHGDVACDSYHRYEEDIEIMADLGINVYRFSVAWPRVIPDGVGEVNEKGLDYYRRFIDKLLEAGIEPMLTLYHWDLPQALQDQGGWANRATVDAFVKYAEVLYKEFDGKVKYWLTINEPWCVSFLSNFIGEHAPGNRDLNLALQISHHLLLAHGKAVQRFRELGISGKIGYAPNVEWKEPFSNREEDIEASRREVGFLLDWFFDPVFKGKYPEFLVDWFKEKGGTFEQNKKEDPPVKESPIGAHQLLEIEREVIQLANAEREKHGLLPLETDISLSYVARKKSEDMVVQQYFAHESPTYGTPFQMLDYFGIYYTYAGENLAYGFSSPAQVLSAWMESDGHRKNILNDVYTHIGIGYDPNGHYWTMLLIRK